MSKIISKQYDVLVVGGGIIGASIFYQLTSEGYKTALVEKNHIASGCTAASGGIVRCFHLESELSDKAVYSWHYYRNFYQHTGKDCQFNECGFLYFPRVINYANSLKEVDRLSKQVPIRWLNNNELQKSFGNLLEPSLDCAVYEPLSGFMNPLQVTKAWVDAARQLGGHCYEKTILKSLLFSDGILTGISTNLGNVNAKYVVFATGPYTPKLLDKLGFSHDLYTQIIQVDLRRPTTLVPSQPAYIDDCNQLNGRPNLNLDGVYLGSPTNKRITNMAECGDLDLTHSNVTKAKGAYRWKWAANSELIGGLRSADCYSKDGLGRVQALNKDNSIFIATAFNGGGFKMAPWIGNQIVNLLKEAKI
jgi:glycine/D-amino acid oxidase-like deaminating enzyme